MKVSFVVPAYNEERLLPATLASLAAGSAAFAARGWATELVVCDNNSSDGTPQVASAAGARVVFEPVNQISRARNAGAGAASGDWLVFVDADSQPSRELLEEVALAIEGGRCVAGGSTVRFETSSLAAVLPVGLWNGISRALHWAAGSFIFCEAAAFREAGGFSEALYAAEEIDLSRRLKKLARAQHRRVVILHRHPLLTSSRKLQLYSVREQLGFMARTIFARGDTLKSAKACYLWYDGRR